MTVAFHDIGSDGLASCEIPRLKSKQIWGKPGDSECFIHRVQFQHAVDGY